MNERDKELALKASDSKTGWLDRQKFADLIRADEREACAVIADKSLYDFTMLTSNPPKNGAAWSIGNAIRARGNT